MEPVLVALGLSAVVAVPLLAGLFCVRRTNPRLMEPLFGRTVTGVHPAHPRRWSTTQTLQWIAGQRGHGRSVSRILEEGAHGRRLEELVFPPREGV